MQTQPGGVTYASSPTVEPVRQGEIASLDNDITSSAQTYAQLVTRLYSLASRLGLAIPAWPASAGEAPPPPRDGQFGSLRDTASRLHRENDSLAAVVEALENL